MKKEFKEIANTGTTTVGIVCKDCVVVAADRRMTMAYMVAHKAFQKIFPINDLLVMTFSGDVGDCQMVAKYLKAQLELYEIRKQRKASVKAAATLLSNILFSSRMLMVQLLLAGSDESGFHLFTLVPDGSLVEDKYIATGSGSVFSYGLLENEWKEGMNSEDAIKLAAKSVNVAMQRDIYTGNGIDVIVVTKKGYKQMTEKEISKLLA